MKPMLAVEAPAVLQFPLYASAKIDGVRAVIKDNVVLSRSMKPIPNAFIQAFLGHKALHGLDGELTVGEPFHPNVMQTTMSGVMRRDGNPDFTYWVFDFWTQPDMPWSQRLQLMQRGERDGCFDGTTMVKLLPQVIIHDAAELAAYERAQLAAGYEGVMVRSPHGHYKFGRSTAREGLLLKVKRFTDGEAVVVGAEERMHNSNAAFINETGNTARSTAKEGMVPMGTLGALLVYDKTSGIPFAIGTGFSDDERDHLWQNLEKYIGKTVTYKHFEQVGVKDAPRFPVYKGFRDEKDMS